MRRNITGAAAELMNGDEFIVIAGQMTEVGLSEKLAMFDAAVAAYNASEKPYAVELSVSRGSAFYDPAADKNYQSVFLKADENMYRGKGEYYQLQATDGGKNSS